jgi:tetratricopeptide (TPR) repeat protein
MGQVYAVERDGWQFALKVLSDLAGADEEDLARFRREAEALAALDHPGIVQLIEAGQHQGVPFLVQELIQGKALSERLGEGPLPVEEAVAILRELARAVEHAHANGVIHRDIKPANVLLTEWGVPKLTDFGLARLRAAQRLTRTGDILGTPAFMAPEQAKATRPAGPSADVYGLGATLYTCLTGRPPFQGSGIPDVLLQVLEQPPKPPSRLRPEVPQALEALCLRCLAKAPEDRPASAGALGEALDALARDARGRAKPTGPRRAPALALTLALAAGLAIAGAVAVGSNGSSEPQPLPATPKEPPKASPASDWLERGAEALERGDLAAAALAFEEATKADPTSSRSWFQLAVARKHQGDMQGAREACDQAIATAPADGDGWSFRASLRQAQGDLPGALEDVTRAIELSPDDAGAFVNRGAVHYALGAREEALRDFDRALQLDPDRRDALQNRAVTLQALGRLTAALADWTRMIEAGPATHDLFLERASLYLETDQLGEAAVDARRAAQLRPSPETWVFLGEIRLRRGQALEAYEAFSEALSLAPRSGALYLRRAQTGAGAPEEDLTQALALDPSLVEAYVQRVALRIARGDAEGAVADLRMALRLEPRNPNLLYQCALLANQLGERQAAGEALDAAVELVPNDASLRRDRAHHRASVGLLRLALEDARAAHAIAPEQAETFGLEGYLLARMGRGAEAAVALRRAVAKAPNSPNADLWRRLLAELER